MLEPSSDTGAFTAEIIQVAAALLSLQDVQSLGSGLKAVAARMAHHVSSATASESLRAPQMGTFRIKG